MALYRELLWHYIGDWCNTIYSGLVIVGWCDTILRSGVVLYRGLVCYFKGNYVGNWCD